MREVIFGRRVWAALVLGLLASYAGATAINGAVLTGSGTYMKLTPPLSNPFGPANSVGQDTFQDTNLYEFDEGQNILIPGPLTVDDVADGLGGGSGPGVIAGGTLVASHYVFFDPNGSSSQTGYVEFDSNIVAVISSTANLSASDFLINTGVNYLNPGLRGLEAGDSVTITGLKRIDVDWTASSPGDYVRVLTEFSPGAVPEPSSIVLVGLGLAGLGFAVRRRRR